MFDNITSESSLVLNEINKSIVNSLNKQDSNHGEIREKLGDFGLTGRAY